MGIPVIFLLIVCVLVNTNSEEENFIKKLEKEMIEVSAKPIKKQKFRKKRKLLKTSGKKKKKKDLKIEKGILFKPYSDYLDLEFKVTPWRSDNL